MDPFTLTVLIIFASALIAGFLKSTLKDRCMKDFHKFPVVAKLKNGKAVWGDFFIESTGFYLNYKSPYINKDHLETGFILYKAEYPTLQGLFRLVEDLSEEDKKRRNAKSLVFEQGWIFSLRKSFRNFFAAVKDALTDTFSLFLGKFALKSAVVSQNQAYVQRMGEGVFEYVGNSYDPVLEKLIGSRVIVELSVRGQWKEYEGLLRNYTKDFIEVLSMKLPLEVHSLMYSSELEIFGISLEYFDGFLTLKNDRLSEVTLAVDTLERIKLEPGQVKKLETSGLPVSISVELEEVFDAVLPRTDAVVRHTTPGGD